MIGDVLDVEGCEHYKVTYNDKRLCGDDIKFIKTSLESDLVKGLCDKHGRHTLHYKEKYGYGEFIIFELFEDKVVIHGIENVVDDKFDYIPTQGDNIIKLGGL